MLTLVFVWAAALVISLAFAAVVLVVAEEVVPGREPRRLVSIDDLGGWLHFSDVYRAAEQRGWLSRLLTWGGPKEQRRVITGSIPVLEVWTHGEVDASPATADFTTNVPVATLELTARCVLGRRLSVRVRRAHAVDRLLNRWLRAFGSPTRMVLVRDKEASTTVLFGREPTLIDQLSRHAAFEPLVPLLDSVRVKPVGVHGTSVLHEVRWRGRWEGGAPEEYDPATNVDALRELATICMDITGARPAASTPV